MLLQWLIAGTDGQTPRRYTDSAVYYARSVNDSNLSFPSTGLSYSRLGWVRLKRTTGDNRSRFTGSLAQTTVSKL